MEPPEGASSRTFPRDSEKGGYSERLFGADAQARRSYLPKPKPKAQESSPFVHWDGLQHAAP